MHDLSRLRLEANKLDPNSKQRQSINAYYSSSSNKAKLFALIFASNLTLDDKSHLLDFPHLTEHNLSNTFITAREVSRYIKTLDPKKATNPDKIP